MKAAVWYGKKDIRVEDREIREMRDNEVRVKVGYAGICGSDLHEYQEGPVFVPVDKEDDLTGGKAPLIMGHEFSGTVVEVGKEVKDFKVGDRVSVNPTVTYGKNTDELDVYDGFSFLGLHTDGGFTDLVNVPETNLYHLPDSLSLRVAATIEPLAVGVQAVKESGLEFGDTVAIFGAGPIGIYTTLAARAAGASKIIVLDLSKERLEKAKECGATHIINSGEVDAVKAIKEIVPGGVDRSFEVAGVTPTFVQAIDATRPRGTMVIVSIFAGDISWPPLQLTNTGVKITSTIAYSRASYQQTIDLMGSGQIDTESTITGEIELDDIVEHGFEKLTNDKSQVKILVKLNGED
ncbi:2,3-butanediol dehydrogenase [Macrococcoides caseolyticum]|uniref:2,3-butanediol dehydrogenase n=1 Tax=Macrococcoides caseolyticum TaxID=69966 RepID=UPI00105DCF6A|nr:2,3-butanediol dehydrogenase [Macrococcus caseolyticus]TDM26333.1 2,3-butanediol dehydrogenase [Macrococcus caseolyticus]